MKRKYSGQNHNAQPFGVGMLVKLSLVSRKITYFVLSISVLLIICSIIVFMIGAANNNLDTHIIFAVELLFSAFLFVLDYIVAGYFYFAAYDKGYKDTAYLLLPFLLPVIGYLLVISLPDRGDRLRADEVIISNEEFKE